MRKGNVLYFSTFNDTFFCSLNKGSVIGWIVSPKIYMLKPWPLVPEIVTVFEDSIFKQVIKLKCGC